ncbi:MAG: dTDP-4-dehydrorhamnose 3,5-epimerase [Lautropia sp.]
MKPIESGLADVHLFEPKVFGDSRGYFFESYNQRVFEALIGQSIEFVQDNESRSARGVLRGLHYQVQQAQGKLIRVIEGAVYDVAVDLRRKSPSFGRATGFVLSAENKRIAWIPPGFAHGFLALDENNTVLYKASDFYAPAHERSLLWNDPALAIGWPLAEVGGSDRLTVSDKDRAGRLLADADTYD